MLTVDAEARAREALRAALGAGFGVLPTASSVESAWAWYGPYVADAIRQAYADGVASVEGPVREAACELEGVRKAYALLNAGMASVCEDRDALKQEVRRLREAAGRV
jgi:hypothetical protein